MSHPTNELHELRWVYGTASDGGSVLRGFFDNNNQWVPTDEHGNSLPASLDERLVAALESIADSLLKIANPIRVVDADGKIALVEDALRALRLKIVNLDGSPYGWSAKAEGS